MEPQQASFDTFSSWILTRLRSDLAFNQEATLSPLYRYFTSLYDDMLANPEMYAIPYEPFVTFFSRVTLSPEETAQHEALKSARMRVRKVVFAYLEFLFKLGQVCEPVDGNTQIPLAVFEKLVSGGSKKARTRHFLRPFERTGLSFSASDPVVVSNGSIPDMPEALATFSQTCADLKDFGFYLFRRCDQAVFEGKDKPDFKDALHLVPPPFKDRVASTDEHLQQMKFKREIFVDGGDMTYRLRYSKKSNQIVYWCRIQETFHADLNHYLRWKLDSDLTQHLFSDLNKTIPGLADRVFTGLKTCQHCYGENCMARATVTWDGVSKEACKEYGWNGIGYAIPDYEMLWMVIESLDLLVSSNTK